jgi:hypothetical protein
MSMTFTEIVERLHTKGIKQVKFQTWVDKNNDPVLDYQEGRIAGVCAVGALRYAFSAGWISKKDYRDLFLVLQSAARVRGYSGLSYANDSGVSFTEIATWG